MLETIKHPWSLLSRCLRASPVRVTPTKYLETSRCPLGADLDLGHTDLLGSTFTVLVVPIPVSHKSVPKPLASY